MSIIDTCVTDNGHNAWKGVRGGLVSSEESSPTSVTLLHALKEISPIEYDRLILDEADEVCRVTYTPLKGRGWTKHFAYGGKAIRGGVVPRYGATRYTTDYLGVANAIVLSHMYRSDNEFNLVTLYAPAYENMTDEIKATYLGTWKVERAKQTMTAKITNVRLMKEITGGMYLRLIDDRCEKRVPMVGYDLIIDIGGGTTEFAFVEDGKCLFDTIRTVTVDNRPIGIKWIMDEFASAVNANTEMQSHYRDGLRVDNRMLRKAFEERQIYIPNRQSIVKLDAEFNRATAGFLSSLANLYKEAGGLGASNVYLTGGGGYAMLPHLADPLLRTGTTSLDFITKDEGIIKEPQLANVKGAQRFAKLHKKMKGVSNA